MQLRGWLYRRRTSYETRGGKGLPLYQPDDATLRMPSTSFSIPIGRELQDMAAGSITGLYRIWGKNCSAAKMD